MRYKTFTIKQPHSWLKQEYNFIILKDDLTDPRVRYLKKWSIGLNSLQPRLKLIDSHDKREYIHTVNDIQQTRSGHLLVLWNPHDVLDNILQTLPAIIGTAVITNVASVLIKKATEQQQITEASATDTAEALKEDKTYAP